MFGYVETPSAYWRAQRMARVAGVDLSAAVVEGWLRIDEFSRLIQRCEACRLSPFCAGWCKSHKALPLPGYCRVKSDIEALSPDT